MVTNRLWEHEDEKQDYSSRVNSVQLFGVPISKILRLSVSATMIEKIKMERGLL